MQADRSAAAVDVSRRVHAVGRVALPLFRRMIAHPPLSCSPGQPDTPLGRSRHGVAALSGQLDQYAGSERP